MTPGNATVADFVQLNGSTYTFNLVPLGQGEVTADLAAGVCVDAAGNSNTAAATFNRVYDTLAPSVWLTSAAANPTRNSPIPVTVTFSEPVLGFTNTDMTPGNATVADFVQVNGSTYTFNLVPFGQGEVTADLAAGACQDSAGNENVAAPQFQRIYDSLAPLPDPLTWQIAPIALSPSAILMQATLTVDENPPVQYQFENLTGGAGSGWQVCESWTNTGLNPNARYAFRVRTRDTLLNTTGWSFTNEACTHATVPLPPLLTMTGPRSACLILNAAITGTSFNADGNPSDTAYAVGIVTNAGPTNYLGLEGAMTNIPVWGVFAEWGGSNGVVVSNLDYEATNTFMVMARNREDVTTAWSSATNAPFEPEVVVDSVEQASDGSGLVTINLTVRNPWKTDCMLRVEYGFEGDGEAAATNLVYVSPASLDAFYGNPMLSNGLPWQIREVSTTNFANTVSFDWDTQSAENRPALTTLCTNVWLALRAHDPAAGRTGARALSAERIDNERPRCVISREGASPTNATVVRFSIVFNEPVTTFTIEDISLHTNGTSGSLSDFSGTGSNYSVSVTSITGNGTVGISVGQDRARDMAGNGNLACPQVNFQIDQSSPVVTVSTPSVSLTRTGIVHYTVSYIGAESVSLTSADVVLDGTDTAQGLVSVSGTGMHARTVSIHGIRGDGTLGLRVKPGTARDAVGNLATGATGSNFTVDNTGPTVAMNAEVSDPTRVSPLRVTVFFSEEVVGFSPADIALGNATPGNFSRLSASVFAFDLIPSGQGEVTADIAAGICTDLAGNGNAAAARFSRVYDSVAPSVHMSSAAPNPTGLSPIPVTVTFSEAVGGFTASDIIATNGAVSAFTGGGSTYSFNLRPITRGKVTVDIAAGTAVDGAGNGCEAANRFVRTYEVLPAEVRGLSASDGAFRDRVRVTWWTATGAETYEVWRGESEDPATATRLGETSALNYEDMTVVAGTACFYWARACNFVGMSGFGAADTGYARNRPGVINDFDGNGASDLGIFDSQTGSWFVRTVAGQVVAWTVPWGWPGAMPVPGDYDQDGVADMAVFDGNTGGWYMRTVPGAVIAWTEFWGWPGAMPVWGDYDGDWENDMAVFDLYTGYWYVRTVAGNIIAWAVPWGWPGAVPVPGDYDGSGMDDLAVYDGHTGYWFIRSVTGTGIAWATPWGWPGAKPVPGDYDGDAVSDLAVFDENTGCWFILSLSGRLITWATA